MDDMLTLPRLYSDKRLKGQEEIVLSSGQAHYVATVMRRREGDRLRLFDGQTGEYVAEVFRVHKRVVTLRLLSCVKAQPQGPALVSLFFTPLVKGRMDVLIEKAVELGVTDLHPVLTHRTPHRKVNVDRVSAQIIEAAEQCERMTLPCLHPVVSLEKAIAGFADDGRSLQWCHERMEAGGRGPCAEAGSAAFLVGPPGGFDQAEVQFLSACQHVVAISLGPLILRAETASLVCLSSVVMQGEV